MYMHYSRELKEWVVKEYREGVKIKELTRRYELADKRRI